MPAINYTNISMAYGESIFDGFVVTRVLLPANENLFFQDAQSDAIYRHSGGGFLTVIRCSDPTWTGSIHSPGTLAILPDSIKNSYIDIQVSSSNTVSTIFRSTSNSILFSNAVLIDVSNSYILPSSTRAVVVEGTVQFTYNSNTYSMDSNSTIWMIAAKPTDVTITGNGKLVIF